MKRFFIILLFFILQNCVFADTEILRPSAAGDSTQHSKIGAATNWECVDEAVSDSDTSYIANSYLSYDIEDLYNIPTPSNIVDGDTINSVRVYVNAKYVEGLSVFQVAPAIKENGVETYGAYQNIISSYALYSKTWTVKPSNSQAWTYTELVNLQIGVRTNTDLDTEVRVTQVYVEIDYTPAPQNNVPAAANQYRKRR